MDVNQFSIQTKKLIWFGILFLISSGVWAQTESKVYLTKTSAKYHGATQTAKK
jgi:hypothetical protein